MKFDARTVQELNLIEMIGVRGGTLGKARDYCVVALCKADKTNHEKENAKLPISRAAVSSGLIHANGFTTIPRLISPKGQRLWLCETAEQSEV
jgi:hypothetical protein